MDNYQDLSALQRLGIAHKQVTELTKKNIFNDSIIAFNPEMFDPTRVNELLKELTGSADGLYRSNISFFVSLKNYFKVRPVAGGPPVLQVTDFTVFNRDANKVYYQLKKSQDYLKKCLETMQQSTSFLNEVDLSVFKKIYEKHLKMIENLNIFLQSVDYDPVANTTGIVGDRNQEVTEITNNIMDTVDKLDDILADIKQLSPKGIYGRGVKYFQY